MDCSPFRFETNDGQYLAIDESGWIYFDRNIGKAIEFVWKREKGKWLLKVASRSMWNNFYLSHNLSGKVGVYRNFFESVFWKRKSKKKMVTLECNSGKMRERVVGINGKLMNVGDEYDRKIVKFVKYDEERDREIVKHAGNDLLNERVKNLEIEVRELKKLHIQEITSLKKQILKLSSVVGELRKSKN